MIELVKDLFHFIWMRKALWLIPLLAVLLVLTGLMLFGATSPLTPFIYALF